jgi:transposase
MAGQRIDIMELRGLIQLKRKGLSNRKVAQALGVSRNTVNCYVRAFSEHELSYEQLEGLSEAELAGIFPQVDSKDPQRYEQLTGYFPEFAKELRKTGCTLLALWRSYLADHPDGYRYTQFVHHFNQWKGKTKASGILRHQAGQKLFMDFAGKTLSWVDRDTGEIRPAQVFVAILPCSQYTYVQATPAQKREDLVRAVTDCKSWLGGVTKAIVGDNMKAVVAKGHKYAPMINKTLKDLALHYGCVIDPTRPYHPKDKALVEGAIRLVYQRIYYPLSNQTFFSLAELMAPFVSCWSPTMITGSTIGLPRDANSSWRSSSRPWTRCLRRRTSCATTSEPRFRRFSHIYLGADKNYYSVPHRYVGRHVEVQYTGDVVVFYSGERIANHRRSRTAGKYTTIATHMPSTHQAYNDWNPEWFARRAAGIGAYAESYIRRLIAQYDYPEIGYKQAQGILALTKQYPADRVEAAYRRAAQGHRAGYRIIANILKNNLDQSSEPELPLDNHIPDHGNIRGGTHYN